MFDPEAFGAAMGEMIREAVKPLHAEIALLKSQLAEKPKDGRDGTDGKDCDMDAVKKMIDEAVKAIPPAPAGKDGIDGKNGTNGSDGKDGTSITLADVTTILDTAIKSIRDETIGKAEEFVRTIRIPENGRDGADGKDGERGEPGEKGADGLGLAGAMIDREGSLLVTLTNGEVKSLGPVVGKDGKDGQDGLSLDAFDLEYIEETHEICVKASCAGRTKELRYPAGGIRPQGYWRDGAKAKAGEAWVHDGSLWIATKDNSIKPDTISGLWIIAARKGRDGERGAKGQDSTPPAPIKLGS